MMDKQSPEHSGLFDELAHRIATALALSVRELLPLLAQDLEAAGERTAYHRDRQSIFTAAAMLRIDAESRSRRTGDALIERARQVLAAMTSPDGTDELQLVDDHELELQILVADLGAQVRQASGALYPIFDRRVAALCGHGWSSDDADPVGARALAIALLAGIRDALGSGAARAAIRSALRARLPAPIAGIIAQADDWLAGQGVQPLPVPERPIDDAAESPDSTQAIDVALAAPVEVLPSGAANQDDSSTPAANDPAHSDGESPADDAPAVAAPAPMAAVEPNAPAAQVAAAAPAQRAPGDGAAAAVQAADVLGGSPLSAGNAPARLTVLPTLQPVVEIERDAVAFAHTIDVVPYSRDARRAFFGNVRGRVGETGASPAQIATVDVVAAMFDYVVDDRRLPEAVKPLMWRLQQPAVALSLLDPGYLGDDPRSLRRLVENLGAITTAFGDDVVRGNELYKRLETVVRAVEIVASVLQTRSAVMSRQVEQEYLRASRSVTQLIERVVNERNQLEAAPGRRNRRDYGRRPNREKEREVTERLTQLLDERLARHLVPDSVKEFVLNVWLRHVRTALLRDGEESAEYKLALQVVDDLLWSLDGERKRQSRRELAQRIPPLIRLLTQGLREIGAKDDEFKSFFDELFLVHLRKMQPSTRGATTTLRAAPATQAVPASPAAGRRGAAAGADAPAGDGDVPVLDVRVPTGGLAARDETPPEQNAIEAADPAVADASARPAAAATASSDRPSSAAQSGAAVAAGDAADAPEKKLLEVLNSLDLKDLPADPQPLALPAGQVIDRLARGDWMKLVARTGEISFAKVAWINSRRTVVLLVRSPDRRALSMRAGELRERIDRGDAQLLAAG